MIPNDSLIKRVKREPKKKAKFAVRPNLSPVAVRFRILTRSRRENLPS